jgi:tubulin polyglutamylase TTLL6/13
MMEATLNTSLAASDLAHTLPIVSTFLRHDGAISSLASLETPSLHLSEASRQLSVNVSRTKYAVVRYVFQKVLGFKLVEEETDETCDVYWCDGGIDASRLMLLKPYQKINHFPGMHEIARKNNLARNLNRMRKLFPKDYDFYPRTWLLPSEWSSFAAQFTKKLNRTFIIKPEASSQGKGIFLTRKLEDISQSERYVAQSYLPRPFLLDGLKFDLRVYVLVAGCDPLRVYIHREGLSRLATEPYRQPTAGNIGDMCMHLTNYAVNKRSPNFIFNKHAHSDDIGHKRSLSWTMDYLRTKGYDVDGLWSRICCAIMKTVAVVQPTLAHTYRSCQPDDPTNSVCFEILGFDVFLDHDLKPYILEVNLSPSLATDSPLDLKIKREVLTDTMRLMHVTYRVKRAYLARKRSETHNRHYEAGQLTKSHDEIQILQYRAQLKRDRYEDNHLGGFQKVYPSTDRHYYDQFIDKASDNYNSHTGLMRTSYPTREESKAAARLSSPAKTAEKFKPVNRAKTIDHKDTRVQQIAAKHGKGRRRRPSKESELVDSCIQSPRGSSVSRVIREVRVGTSPKPVSRGPAVGVFSKLASFKQDPRSTPSARHLRPLG